jgi:hypothetical protein
VGTSKRDEREGEEGSMGGRREEGREGGREGGGKGRSEGRGREEHTSISNFLEAATAVWSPISKEVMHIKSSMGNFKTASRNRAW